MDYQVYKPENQNDVVTPGFYAFAFPLTLLQNSIANLFVAAPISNTEFITQVGYYIVQPLTGGGGLTSAKIEVGVRCNGVNKVVSKIEDISAGSLTADYFLAGTSATLKTTTGSVIATITPTIVTALDSVSGPVTPNLVSAVPFTTATPITAASDDAVLQSTLFNTTTPAFIFINFTPVGETLAQLTDGALWVYVYTQTLPFYSTTPL